VRTLSAHPYRKRPGTRHCAVCGAEGRQEKHRKPDGLLEYRCPDCNRDKQENHHGRR